MTRPIRRSQAVSPFGVGAMVDFPGPVSLIHAGLDAWPFDERNPDHREFRVDDEPRLAKRLGVDFFVQPPDFRMVEGGGAGSAVNLGLKLPFLRFPLWHSCPRCGRMFEAKYHHRSAPDCLGPIGSGAEKGRSHSRRRAVQVRFVSACQSGHLRDFPWIEWLGLDRSDWDGIRNDRWLRIISTGSASIAGVVIVAERQNDSGIIEVARRSLAGAFSVEPDGTSALTAMNIMCNGQNPALGLGDGGEDPTDPCGQNLRAVLRGASNLYFGDVRSSIYVPDIEDNGLPQPVLDLLDDYTFKQELLNGALAAENGTLGPKAAGIILRRRHPESEVKPEVLAGAVNTHILHEILTHPRLTASALVQKVKVAADGKVSSKILADLINTAAPDWSIDPGLLVESVTIWLKRREGIGSEGDSQLTEDVSDKTYRAEEYRAFCRDGQDGLPKVNLLVRSKPIESYTDLVRSNFSRVALLDKLRETRAFVGFSRIYASSNMPPAQRWKLISRTQRNWLPAAVVRGEGIFLRFDEERLANWDKEFGALHRERLRQVNRNLQAQAARRQIHVDDASPVLVLMHTFAHVLISQLVFDCGYGSSSLRERIYFSDTQPQMSGILIYTAAGDSEGTMGGLVRMGEPEQLDRTIARALDRARWCSSDPVCIESTGQGPDNCNLAACHSCGLLPETSCEMQNRLLDRGMLIGDLNRPEIGFFS
ncbi:MAG: DUF1998 domain-containing protein [Limnohabitans sp.]|jgi:hypothetical protein|uniref:DUF1998 domain-containing protein n=1 Tax=Limnohabitans sp. TaxID=1907725 RepID=UPI0025D0E7A2|nr:DUF1998 domain-containing protein [Limnohabitans sp.]MCO4090185.1 DUF1998 domain-containing protein [Limnohabitans sp.]